MGLHSALVCLYECAQRKMNEILIHEGKRKLVPWHCFCVLLGVNCEHIVLGHNGIFRLQTEAMMDSFLSLLHMETNSEIINNIVLFVEHLYTLRTWRRIIA